MPTSDAREVAVLARGPVMRCTIFDLNASLYSVIIRLFSASCNVPPDNLPERIKRGDNYPDAGGFDPTPYVRSPIVTVSSGVTLALAAADACPKDAPANVKKAQKRLRATAEKARDDLAARNRALGVYSEEDSRVLDNEADRCWGALRMRLQGMAMLPGGKYPNARRAAVLDAQLFGEGSELLKAEYVVQGPAMAAILQRIDEDKLAADVDAVAGPEFLKAIRDVQPRYEAMVSERLRRDKAMGQNLLETTRALQAAIVNYTTKLIGTIDDDDPASVEAVRVALLPIANFRESAARSGAAPTAGEEAPS